MPLLSGSAQSVIDANIRELKRSGYSKKQAVAIALKRASKLRSMEREKNKLSPKVSLDTP